MDIEFIIYLVGIMLVVFVHDDFTHFIHRKDKNNEGIQTNRYYALMAMIILLGLYIMDEVRDIRKIDIDQTCKSTYNIY